jgi:hypothetical protein
MMGDGTKALEVEEKVATKDIAEILASSIEFANIFKRLFYCVSKCYLNWSFFN